MLKQRFIILLFLLLPSITLAGSYVRLTTNSSLEDDEQTNVYSYLSNSANGIRLISAIPSTYGNEADSPVQVYAPVTTGASEQDRLLVPTAQKAESFNLSVGTTPNLSGLLRLKLEITGHSVTQNLIGTVLNADGSYYIFQKFDNGITSSQSGNVINFDLNLTTLCSQTSTKDDANGVCEAFNADSTKTLEIYLFTVNNDDYDSYTVTNAISAPSDFPNGLYLKVSFSNQIPGNQVDVVSVDRGDGRLFLNFDDNNITNIDPHYKTVALSLDDSIYNGNSVGSVIASNLRNGNYSSDVKIFDPQKDGELNVTGLDNNSATPYDLGLVQVNFYQFTSVIGVMGSGDPEAIENFISESSCYLVSAGFGRDHYVLKYFRAFRDNVLSKFSLGRLFIKTYYETAPQYVSNILESKGLQFLIVILSYGLYGGIKYFYVLFGVFIGAFFLYKRYLKKKNNRLIYE